MIRLLLPVLFVAAVMGLTACGEIDQAKSGDAVNRGDQPPYKGAANAQVDKSWKAGDKAAWEHQVRQRGQYQNEYVKTN